MAIASLAIRDPEKQSKSRNVDLKTGSGMLVISRDRLLVAMVVKSYKRLTLSKSSSVKWAWIYGSLWTNKGAIAFLLRLINLERILKLIGNSDCDLIVNQAVKSSNLDN